jgi:hypothetical protein
MKIKEFIGEPKQAFIKAERYLNDGSPSGFTEKNTTSKYTCPRSKIKSFKLWQIRFENNVYVEDFGVYKKDYILDKCIFVHPDMLRYKKLLRKNDYTVLDELKVVPTASGRTVLSLEKEYFVKLAYMGYLGRLIRHMNAEVIRSACEVSRQLMTAIDGNKMNEKFGFLKEDFGRVAYIQRDKIRKINIDFPFNSNDYYEWGMLFREVKPYPYTQEKEYMIPFFALYGKEYDPINKKTSEIQDKPLLVQLFEMQNKSMHNFLLYDIIMPIYNLYFDALIYSGVELEAHSQNMLLTINVDYKIKRIVCRDLESAGRDVPVMEYFGIEYEKIGDYKLGEYLITPLINVASKYEYVDRVKLLCEIRRFNAQFIDRLPRDFFPPEWCYYQDINWDLEKKERVYIWNDKPKYR